MNHAAKLLRYGKHSQEIDKGERKVGLKYPDESLPKHGDAVWVQYKKIKAGAEVQKIKKRSETDSKQPGWIAGWVCINGANISGKVFERVFLDTPNEPLIPVDKSLWEELIRNYQDIHKKELEKRAKDGKKPSDYLGNKPGQTAWSRHVYSKEDLNLRHGTLCYAEIENSTIKAIFPVMISRQLFECSPLDLLDESLRPAKSLDQLSPADRVFGWVNQKGSGAYRGQIRIGSIKTERTDAVKKFNDLPLNILGQPKPQQGRFYVAESPSGEAQTQKRDNENAGYKSGHGLRGRKVYPHHAHIEDEKFWFENSEFNENGNDWKFKFPSKTGKDYYREYLRPKNNNQQQRDSQNRSIKGWVRPQTEFTFDIHFTNLSKLELGALVWLLRLPENHFHRLGGGKPYGFGSVRLEITSEEITSGEDLKEFYSSLDSTPKQSISADECKDEFEKNANKDILDAFKVACKGFDDKLPIHYPRTSPEPKPEGESYKWFVENNRINRKQVVNRYTLPNLVNDSGLPILGDRK
jgi:CRISPR-associated protein (TIGR03986 family)